MSMMIKSRAPVRIDFGGGWTDVPPFSREAGGAVVSAAVNRYTYATLTPRDDERINIVSGDFDAFVEVRSFRELEYDGSLDIVKAALRVLGLERGLDIFVRCDAPPGSGLGSSASISIALIGLLNALQEDRLSAHETAELARRLEIEELGIAGGKQDQYAAVIGGINYMEFMDPAVHASRLALADSTLAELEKQLVLCYTGESRVSGRIIETVASAYKRGAAGTVGALHNLKRIAREMKTALIKGDLAGFGELLARNWENQKALDPSVTSERVEALFETALGAGAAGGKALGAGGGGCVLFLAESNREHILRRALQDAGAAVIDFNFDFKGLQVWTSESR